MLTFELVNLQAHIAPLVFENDCVVLPGFGAFIGNPHGAEYISISNKLRPPYKKLSFNAKLIENDGLIANHIASELGMSYEDALLSIETELKQWRSQLANGEKLRIDKIGVLFQDSNAMMRFEPDNAVNLLPDSYGLMPVYLKELVQLEVEKAPVNKAIERENRREAPEKVQYRVPRLIYLFMAFPLMLYVLWLSTQTNLFREDKFIISDLNPFQNKICEQYKQRSALPLSVELPSFESKYERLFTESKSPTYVGVDFESGRIFPNEKKGFFVSLFKRTKNKTKSSVSISNEELKYHLISGCFSVRSNADRMVSKIRKEGYNASIIDQRGGLYRVSAASFARREEAVASIDQIRQRYSSGTWLLVK